LPLYKYMTELQWAESLVNEGEVFFNSLSYFKNYEDGQIRGDKLEGERLYEKPEGIEITVVSDNNRRLSASKVQFSANIDNFFVYCLSTELSQELMNRFNAAACIEILNPKKFISKIRKVLQLSVLAGEISYYLPTDEPGIEWQQERIVLSKTKTFDWQKEYRLAFSQPQQETIAANRSIKLGNLSKICRVHYEV